MMDACKQGRRRGWALEVTINKCTFAAAAVRLRCIVRWLNINAMLCWKLSSLEVAWPARAYTALLPWWELQRILNSVAVCGKLNTWLRACTLNWLISSDSSAAQILHTHLHYQSFNLSDPALLTTMPRRKSIMETIKLKWPLNLFEEKIISEYLVSWYRQEVCPGQSWVTSSNWGIWTSSIRTFRLLWHKGHTGLQQKGWNIGCYLGSISTLWNFLHPQPKVKSMDIDEILSFDHQHKGSFICCGCENQCQAKNETIKQLHLGRRQIFEDIAWRGRSIYGELDSMELA